MVATIPIAKAILHKYIINPEKIKNKENTMKIRVSTLALLLAITAIFTISCNNMSGDWAASIDDKVISIKEFNKYYYTQNKMMANVPSNEDVDKLAEDPAYANHPFLNKTNFLDHLIAQKLLYNRALKDKSIDKDELDSILELTKIQTASQYYLGQKLKDKIEVSDEEVTEFYNKNRSQFAGRTANEATAYIRQQLISYKSRQEANQYVMDILAESKVKKDGLKEYLAKTKKSENTQEEETEK